jgi:hypothetical protein
LAHLERDGLTSQFFETLERQYVHERFGVRGCGKAHERRRCGDTVSRLARESLGED